MGGGSQPDGRVAAALLQCSADEEPWVSALRLDKGVSEAPEGLYVHGGHVDLSEVMSVGGIIASRWGRTNGEERGGGTPSTVGAGVVNGGGDRRRGDICKPDGRKAVLFPESRRGTGLGEGGGGRRDSSRA